MIYRLLLDTDLTDQMRTARKNLLTSSDWSQLPDATCDRQAWATYRQALRDFPATWTPSPEADFPDTP
jgi:hypothetical protein